jgi:hypothetical protein
MSSISASDIKAAMLESTQPYTLCSCPKDIAITDELFLENLQKHGATKQQAEGIVTELSHRSESGDWFMPWKNYDPEIEDEKVSGKELERRYCAIANELFKKVIDPTYNIQDCGSPSKEYEVAVSNSQAFDQVLAKADNILKNFVKSNKSDVNVDDVGIASGEALGRMLLLMAGVDPNFIKIEIEPSGTKKAIARIDADNEDFSADDENKLINFLNKEYGGEAAAITIEPGKAKERRGSKHYFIEIKMAALEKVVSRIPDFLEQLAREHPH